MSSAAAPKAVVLDTGVLSLLAARSRRPERIAHWPQEALSRIDSSIAAISPVTVAEVEFGLLSNPNHVFGKRQRTLLAQLAVLPIDPLVIREWARIKHAAIHGIAIGDNDLWIAAAASAVDAPVFTCDTGFGAVKDLVEVIYLPRTPDSAPAL